MAKSKWKNYFVIRVYELAKSGMTERRMAKVLGISLPTFISWEKKKKLFKLALQTGRKAYKGRGSEVASFRDYVYQRLTPELKQLWLQINKIDKLGATGGELVEAILAKRGRRVRQHLFIYAWTASNFSISSALRKVNISRGTFDLWRNKDPGFAKLIDEINWHKKNFFEDHLCKLVAGGSESATVFVNRTFNRDRGYNEKVDVDMNVSGEINQNVVKVDLLKVPLKARKALLKSLRQQKKN